MNLNRVEIDNSNYYLPPDEQLYKGSPELKTPENGDWYVYYHIWDFEKGRWLPQKYYSTVLNKKDIIKNLRERKINGAAVKNTVYKALKNGINPKTGNPISPFLNKSAKDILAEAANDSPVPTVENAIKKWLSIKAGKDNAKKSAPENKENTENTYNSFFNIFLDYAKKHNYEKKMLNEVPKHFVYSFFEERYSKGTINDSTWNIQLGYIKGLFSHFAKLYDYKNTIKNIDNKEDVEDSERFEPFTKEQLKAIFNFLDNPQVIKYRQYEVVSPPNKLLSYASRAILYTFIRISELRRLKIKNVRNYKEGFFDLSTGITKNKKKIFNRLYIDPVFVAELEKLNWEKYFDNEKLDDYYVFTNNMVPYPVKVNSYRLSKSFRTVLEKLEIYNTENKKYSLYSMKASGNIDAYESGWDLFQISIQNRHSTVKQTEVYLRKLKCNIAERPRPSRAVY